MGMVIGVDVRDPLEPDRMAEALESVFSWLRWVDATFSTYRDDSEISRLAAGELVLSDCCAEVRQVLERCVQLREQTGGFFDASAQGRLDPSGLVKGWSVERASALLDASAAVNHCINAGGDVRTRGEPEPGRRWRVGLAHPQERHALCTVIAIGDGAVATSGIAERGAHVLDPHTGKAALELASVTVVGEDLGTTDAYATAALAMGVDAPAWLEGLEGFEAYAVDAGGFAWQSAGFQRYQVPADA